MGDRTFSFESASAAVWQTLKGIEPRMETVPLDQAVGRVLASDIHSDMDMPPFDKSAMDGFACARADLGNSLAVVETIAAGKLPTLALQSGQCARIMTGACVPAGADVVFKFEDSETAADGTVRYVGTERPHHICLKGEDVAAGQKVLDAGTRLNVRHVAILASVGCAVVPVYKRPVIGILATGDELVEPSATPGDGQIRNSNAWQLQAQVARAGAIPVMLGTASDTRESLHAHIAQALGQCDMLLMTGGVSMGDFDLVPTVLQELGATILFDSVWMKPGKPTTFALRGSFPVWCLPGNPVSTFVVFELFVSRFIAGWMGASSFPPDPSLLLEQTITRKKADRLEWVPVSLTQTGGIVPVEYHGSAHFYAIGSAFGLIAIPQGVTSLEHGQRITVRQI